MTFSISEPIKLDTDTINKIAAKLAELTQPKQKLQADPVNDLITPKEACDLLKCSSVTLWRYEKKGRITAYGIGGKKFFKRSLLLQSIVKKITL